MENLLNLPGLMLGIFLLIILFLLHKYFAISKENSRLTEQSATDAANLKASENYLLKNSEYTKSLQQQLTDLNN